MKKVKQFKVIYDYEKDKLIIMNINQIYFTFSLSSRSQGEGLTTPLLLLLLD